MGKRKDVSNDEGSNNGKSENGENENEDSEYDSDDESSFDEMSVGIALELPKRANRSKKYSQLVGDELEKDQQFWEHSTWEEEEKDEDYNCSEGESFYEYETDSDFDDDESSQEEEVVEKVERKKKFKTKSYIDPALVRTKKLQHVTRERRETKNLKPASSIEFLISNRSKRDTTKRKTEAIIAQRERDKIVNEARRAVKKVRHGISSEKLPSQEELLEEAKRVEEMNRESLEILLASEVEKKRYTKYTRQKAKGHYDIWISWNSLVSVIKGELDVPIVECALEMYFFTDGKIPQIYEQAAVDESPRVKCAVSGNVARYIDPLTRLPFDSVDSFKRIREQYRQNVAQSSVM